MEQALDRRLAKALSGECAYSGCHEMAADGTWCEPHGVKERKRDAVKHLQMRAGREARGECIDCGEKLKRNHPGKRCRGCAKANCDRLRDWRARRANVTGASANVTDAGADPASTRVARTKIERAYAKLADGTERFIERVVFRSRGAQSKESQDVDGAADVGDVVFLLTGSEEARNLAVRVHLERLRELRAVEGSLGRIARDEARAAVADHPLRATRLLAGETARITPEGWRVVRDGLARIGERDDDE